MGYIIKCCISAAFLLIGTNAFAATRTAPNEFFDERTGATLTVVREALTFSRVRQSSRDSNQDYVGLVATQVDRSGELHLFLIAYCWTRTDPRSTPPPEAAGPAGTLTVTADDQQLQFQPLAEVPKELTDRRRLLNDGAFYAPLVYSVTLETLRTIAKSKALLVTFGVGPPNSPADSFELWEGQRALQAFVELMVNPGTG